MKRGRPPFPGNRVTPKYVERPATLVGGIIIRALFAITAALLTALGLASSGGPPPTKSMYLQSALGVDLRGGWNLETPDLVESAATAGVSVAFLYGEPPKPSSPLGKALMRHHMRVVSAEISGLVSAYECTRTHTVARKPAESRQPEFCNVDAHYSLVDLLADTKSLIQRDLTNPLVAGYWVLDDAPAWDFGSLKDVLSEIRKSIPSRRPVICGFGASLEPGGRDVWEAGLAENFSPNGCDVVAPYIYADSQNTSDPEPMNIDWSMSGLLAKIRTSLSQSGWDPSRQPLLGIGQAWGGQKSSDTITYPPRVTDMLNQALGYCAAGAQGIVWYAWTITSMSHVLSPANVPSLHQGVSDTAATCRELRARAR